MCVCAAHGGEGGSEAKGGDQDGKQAADTTKTSMEKPFPWPSIATPIAWSTNRQEEDEV